MKKLLIFLCLLSACMENIEKRASEKYYFDLVQYAEAQASLLQNIPVRRETVLDTKQETQVLDTMQWSQVLEWLKMVDINRPVLKEMYETQENNLGEHTLTQYIAKKENLTTRVLNIKRNTQKQVVEIYALYKDENYLYHTEKEITLKAQNDSLKSLSIKGFQKILLKDTLRFEAVFITAKK